MIVDDVGIGRSGYWTKWVLDKGGMTVLGVDFVGMDELALGRRGCGDEVAMFKNVKFECRCEEPVSPL